MSPRATTSASRRSRPVGAAEELARIGAAIRTTRERLGLSQETLALRTSLHRTYIGGVERGERNISILNLLAIARALSVQVGALVTDRHQV